MAVPRIQKEGEPLHPCPHCNHGAHYNKARIADLDRAGLISRGTFICVNRACRRLIQIKLDKSGVLHLIKMQKPLDKRARQSRRMKVDLVSESGERQISISLGDSESSEDPFAAMLDEALPDPNSPDRTAITKTTKERELAILQLNARFRDLVEKHAVLGGRFRLDKIIGQGATGLVASATDVKSKQMVAVKYHAETGMDNDEGEIACRRVTRVIGLQGLIHSPYAVKPICCIKGRFGYTTIEWFVPGKPLMSRIASKQCLSELEAITLGCQIGTVFAETRQWGIVHRDIKPANIMVEGEGGDIKSMLVDWGLARTSEDPRDTRAPFEGELEGIDTSHLRHTLTMNGFIVGTVNVIAPEQCDGRVDWRTDQYSLAATLYWAVLGEPIFAKGSIDELVKKAMHADPVPLERAAAQKGLKVSKAFSDVLARALHKDPAKRYQTPEAFIRALKNCQRRGCRRIIKLMLSLLFLAVCMALAYASWIGALQPWLPH